MAWWNTHFIFSDDTLIAEGVNPVPLNELEMVTDEAELAGETARYTQVVVSGYALYGQLRGYYALGVAHWKVNKATGRIFVSEASRRRSEPVSSLTPAQRTIVKECLINISPSAWETSHESFRRNLELKE